MQPLTYIVGSFSALNSEQLPKAQQQTNNQAVTVGSEFADLLTKRCPAPPLGQHTQTRTGVLPRSGRDGSGPESF
jgi:hypothetical protein